MVLSVFGDESSDETRQRVFAVSGVWGTEPEWQQVEAAWTAQTGGEVFHAAEWNMLHVTTKRHIVSIGQIQRWTGAAVSRSERLKRERLRVMLRDAGVA